MHRVLWLVSLSVVACSGPTKEDTYTDTTTDMTTDTGPTDGPTADTADPSTFLGSVGTPCALDPDPPDEAEVVRVSADGVVWAASRGDLYRYERTDAGKASCTLTGSLVWSSKGLNDVTDFALDGSGRPHLLVFFDDIVRLSAEGTEELRCEDPPFSGHGIAVDDSGDRVWTLAISNDILVHTDLTKGVCTPGPKAGVKLSNPLGQHGAYVDGDLAVSYFDAAGKLPPGTLVDPGDGVELLSLGLGSVLDDPMPGIADIAPAAEDYWVAGSLGDLWLVDGSGKVTGHYEPAQILPTDTKETVLSMYSVAYSATGDSYVSAGWLDVDGIWAIEL
ncbi:MAG: hypothetical protein KTR31_25275 [Myxococcales bacterium]|nr:hypothetical protein [Myxococcales bacterium]